VRGLVGFLKGDLTVWTSSEGQEELVKQIITHRTMWVAYDEGNMLLFEEDGEDGSVVAAHQDPAEGGHAERFLQDVDLAELPTLPYDGARVSTEDGAPQDHGDGEPSVGADVEEDDEMPDKSSDEEDDDIHREGGLGGGGVVVVMVMVMVK